MSEPEPQTAGDLKQRADAAYHAGNHRIAIKLYTRAIKLEPQNHILFSNRSAAKAAAGNRWTEALEDAEKTIELEPSWPKGYIRKAIAYRGMYRFNEAIKTCKQALALADDPAIRDQIRTLENERYRPRYADREPRDFEFDNMPHDVLVAMAMGRNLPVTSSTKSAEIRRKMIAHGRRFPNFNYPLRRHYLLPSSDQNNEDGPRPIELDLDAPGASIESAKREILNLLGPDCKATDSQTLYSEDIAEILRGNPKGTGVGYTYKTWEIIMDDHCIVRNRPFNPEATRLLRRPRTLGPVLVLEATHLKLTPEKSLGPDGTPLIDTILYHPLDLQWLESDEWKGLREEWQHLRTHGVEPVDGHNRDIAYGTHNDMQIRPFLDAMGIRMVYEVEPVIVDR